MRSIVALRREEHELQKTMTAPETIGRRSQGPPAVDERQPGLGHEEPVLHGVGASPGIARGTARLVAGADEFERIRPGDIIVCHYTNPSWIPVFTIAGGLVTNVGGVTSHPAVVAREFALPAVVGARGATERIEDGRQIEIDGTAGTVRLV
jgi:rifampicin phosphotransferase